MSFERCWIGLLGALLVLCGCAGTGVDEDSQATIQECLDLTRLPHLTIGTARLLEADELTPRHCYVQGVISPQIRYHLQLPLPEDWNGRFLNWGDGAKDGDLDFADHRLAQGYAVANSNTGHDAGSEPGASFGWNNRQAEIDFGYRAVHVMVNAAQSLIEAYYGRAADYSYHEGCSTGGRQGLMEAQRFPYDFDGIVAGAPVNYYQELNLTHVWMLQRVFQDDFAGVPAFDSNGDGAFDNLRKLEILNQRVMEKCDHLDGVRDGILDDPLTCPFDPEQELAGQMCQQDGEACFTASQLSLIQDFYRGARDSQGGKVLKGLALGSEPRWVRYFPHAENGMFPLSLHNASNHGAYLFYQQDPGIPVPRPADLSYRPKREGLLPEWAWWEFDIDEVNSPAADFMKGITNAVDPDLSRFLLDKGGKLMLYHGWLDVAAHPEPTLDYYREVVAETFAGDLERARDHARLFMFPGMAHCRGGTGPDEWDPLEPLVEWVERGRAPQFVVAAHRRDGLVDNERPICAYPQRAVYRGPEGGADEPANWVADNFACGTTDN